MLFIHQVAHSLSGNDLDRPFFIDDLFAEIQESISNGVASLDVSYNVNRQYPERISTDVNKMMADEEISNIVIGFRSFCLALVEDLGVGEHDCINFYIALERSPCQEN